MTETFGTPPAVPPVPAPPKPRTLPAPVPELPYRAVTFDLDGTLVALEQEFFLTRYFELLEDYAASVGVKAKPFKDALNAGIREMMVHQDSRVNETAFWDKFREVIAVLDPDAAQVDWTQVCTDYYKADYCHIGDDILPMPAVHRALAALNRKGYPVLLLTTPLFPREGVWERLRWAGLEDWADLQKFHRITTMDNSYAAKPRLSYFTENLIAMGLGEKRPGALRDPSEVLHVGNNTLEDGVFRRLGADFFLVTDYLINQDGSDIESFKHGTWEQFADWCEALPPCTDPITDIITGPVDFQKNRELLGKLTGRPAAEVESEQLRDVSSSTSALD